MEAQLLHCNIDVRTSCDAEARGHTKCHLPHEGFRNVITEAGGCDEFKQLRDSLTMISPDIAPTLALYDSNAGR